MYVYMHDNTYMYMYILCVYIYIYIIIIYHYITYIHLWRYIMYITRVLYVCTYIYIYIQVWFVWLCPPITVGTIRCVTSRSKWGGRCSILNSRWMICPADYKASSHTRRLFGRWPVISKNVLKCDTL